MKEYKEVTKKVTEVDSITCDKCGETASKKEFIYGDLPMHEIKISGGYNSRWPGDLTTIEIDFCEDCLEEVIGEYARVTKGKL